MENDISGGLVLATRLLLVALFLIFGWRKLTDHSGTVRRMVQDGAPVPVLATFVAILIELPVSFAVALGAFSRALGFVHARKRADCASLLDDHRCE